MNGKRNNDVKLPFTKKPQILLFLLTVCCVASMGYYYLKKENILSISRLAGIVTVPIQNGINKVGSLLTGFEGERLTLKEANAKIESLEAENEDLREQMVTYDLKISEYQDMEELLDLKNTYADYETVGASVIFSSSGTSWFSTFTINKGSSDGLKEGMNVIAGGGLVGYLSEVAESHSTVTTIINDNSNVSGMQSTTQDSCVVMGDLLYMQQNGLLTLKYMDKDFDISRDTVIVTSKISDRYLPGIVIGYAQDVTVDANGLAASGYLKPAVDFQHISNVLVITTEKQQVD